MPMVNGTYYTDEEIRAIKARLDDKQFEEFLISGVIGAVTGSALIGGLLGGSFLGGIVGDMFTDD